MKADFETRLLQLEQWAWGGPARVPQRIIQCVQQMARANPPTDAPIDRTAIIDEMAKIEWALRDPNTNNAHYCQLYAAQQALSWAAGGCAAAPFDVIMSGRVMPLVADAGSATGIQEG